MDRVQKAFYMQKTTSTIKTTLPQNWGPITESLIYWVLAKRTTPPSMIRIFVYLTSDLDRVRKAALNKRTGGIMKYPSDSLK